MHLPKLDVQLSTFRLDVCVPSESKIQMEAKLFNLGGDWDGCIVEKNGGHVFLWVVNVTLTDLACFTFFLHQVYHSAREAR